MAEGKSFFLLRSYEMEVEVRCPNPKYSVILHRSLHLPRVQVPHTKSEIAEQNDF